MLVVAWLYNSNGMASWCWEAAMAMHESGEEVILVYSPSVSLPPHGGLRTFAYMPPEAHPESGAPLSSLCARLSSGPSGFLAGLDRELRMSAVIPSAYYLNQSNLHDSHVAVPQYVVAWAYPSTLWGYLSKVPSFGRFRSARDFAIRYADVIGWWRRDWRAYRSASGVLAVSERLTQAIRRIDVTPCTVNPGTKISEMPERTRTCTGATKLLIVALDLDDSRKGVRRLLRYLGETRFAEDTELTLVGEASPDLRNEACKLAIPAHFVGPRSRREVQMVMEQHDVFLFGSVIDDWGYVLIEAMAAGMTLLAPDVSPFDEIVGDAGFTFELRSLRAFSSALEQALRLDRHEARITSMRRASKYFSRPAFAESLLAAGN